MTISERIFELINKKGFTQKEFSRRTGIAESTISDWKKKGTNPVSDKILSICEVLEVSPYFLLSGKEKDQQGYTDIKPWKAADKKEDTGYKKETDPDKKEDMAGKKEVQAVIKNENRYDPLSYRPAVKLPEIATIASDDDDYSIREEKEDTITTVIKEDIKVKAEKKEIKPAKEEKDKPAKDMQNRDNEENRQDAPIIGATIVEPAGKEYKERRGHKEGKGCRR